MTEIFAIIKIWQFDTINLGVAIMKIKSYPYYNYSNFLLFYTRRQKLLLL